MNPRITDIATRVDRYQLEEGMPLLAAFSKVAEEIDLDVSIVDLCYGEALLSDGQNDYVPDYLDAAETKELNTSLPDPFDTSVDDWNPDYWR